MTTLASTQPRWPSRYILGTRVNATNYDEAIARILDWARERKSRYVCISTVHMVMEAYDDRAYQAIVNGADLVTSDGMPLVWALRMLRLSQATRVYGPELTPRLLAVAERAGVSVGFFGGSQEVIDRILDLIRERHPALEVPFAVSPPFRPLTPAEDADYVRQINESGVEILFVGLGCPKQERSMADHVGRVHAPMLGVGAAFDFLAGVKPQAPRWMQAAGLEWFFRLLTEPRRLWKRYAIHNPRFVALFARQLLSRNSKSVPHSNPN